MARLSFKFAHQEVLSVCTLGLDILAGFGGCIAVYRENNRSISNIFKDQKIHILKTFKTNTVVAVGGKHLALCRLQEDGQIDIVFKTECSDWVLDAELINDEEIVMCTSHNQAQVWNTSKRCLQYLSTSSERCILYSAKVCKISNNLFILAGTVFSEVIAWQPIFESEDVSPPVLFRLTGHKGVIFSISIRQLSSSEIAICTTSDDRSVRLFFSDGFRVNSTLQKLPAMYGHKARVWKALLLPDRILTIGEDSLLCCWTLSGQFVRHTELYHSGGIHSIINRGCSPTGTIVSGGGDGGILELPLDDMEIVKSSSVAINHGEGIPRKVKFLSCWGIAYVTDNNVFYCREFNGQPKHIYGGSKDVFQVCTSLATSPCGRFIGVTIESGFLHIFDTSSECGPYASVNVGNGRRCQFLIWRDNVLLVESQGVSQLFIFDPKKDVKVSFFFKMVIPKAKERSSTCFLCLPNDFENITLIGDRSGNLLVYKAPDENPVQRLIRLHSHLGISDLAYKKATKTIFSIGAKGVIKELDFYNNTLCLLRTFNTPIESAVRILNTYDGMIIAGFQATFFQLWHFEKRMILAEFKCGGAHRSFDVVAGQNKIHFVFIKNKHIYYVPLNIKTIIQWRKGYHAKTINCLVIANMMTEPIVVSGGDDNTVRIVQVGPDDLKPLHILEQHISSVRSIKLHALTDQSTLIVAVGGREQISITELNFHSLKCKEILSYLHSSPLAEGRFMCLDTMELTDGSILILVGSSSCSLMVFRFKNLDLEFIGSLLYTHCILHVTICDNYALTFGTDGKATFWDLSEFLTGKGSLPLEPVSQHHLHQSGINSFTITEMMTDKFLLITGGDDNVISLSVLRLNKTHSCPWKLHSHWTTNASHSSQITGLLKHDRWLLSTSIDQRVVMHSLQDVGEEVHAHIEEEIMVTVPDAHGLAILSSEQAHLTVCVYGRGIEVITVDTSVVPKDANR